MGRVVEYAPPETGTIHPGSVAAVVTYLGYATTDFVACVLRPRP